MSFLMIFGIQKKSTQKALNEDPPKGPAGFAQGAPKRAPKGAKINSEGGPRREPETGPKDEFRKGSKTSLKR